MVWRLILHNVLSHNRVGRRLWSRLPVQGRRWLQRWASRALPRGFALPRGESAPIATEIGRSGHACPEAPGGLDVHGYFSRWLGLGECARWHVQAMLQCGWPVAVHDVDIAIPHRQLDGSLTGHFQEDLRYRRDLIFVNPDHWADVLATMQQRPSGKRYRIGYWFWELERFPQPWLAALDQVDELMVSSAFVEQALRAVTDKPVTRVPIPMTDSPASALERRDFGLDDGEFVFFFAFDFNSSMARKNPLAVIEAFRQAFSRDVKDVRLLIKTSNAAHQPLACAQLMRAARCDPRISIRDDMLPRQDMRALLRCVDVYVSLHRSEGFGLGMAEAMQLGKPVVATGYSGNLEFMHPVNSCLVDYQLVPVRPGEYLGAAGQYWAQANVGQAADYLYRLYQDRAWGRALGLQAAEDMANRFSAAACVQAMAARLHALDDEERRWKSSTRRSLP